MLGASLGPQNRRSSLLLFLARNPDTVNTPQTPQEFYRQHWMDSFGQDQETISQFLGTCGSMKRALERILCSPCHIGITKFALETCEQLVMSKITDWSWLKKEGANIGIEVCVVKLLAWETQQL